MKFQYDCVNCPKEKLDELNYIVDNYNTITHNTFKKNIGLDNYKELISMFNYDKFGGTLTLAKDWSVSFGKCILPNKKRVYFVCHSGIEYIFY